MGIKERHEALWQQAFPFYAETSGSCFWLFEFFFFHFFFFIQPQPRTVRCNVGLSAGRMAAQLVKPLSGSAQRIHGSITSCVQDQFGPLIFPASSFSVDSKILGNVCQ